MTIHLDISQLVFDPRRTGIQRAERELIRHWPGPSALVPCRYDPVQNRLLKLDRAVFDILCGEAPPGGVKAEAELLEPYLAATTPATPRRLLSAELFVDPARAAFYTRPDHACRRYWLVYDFLPWLYPQWFSTGSPARLMPYLHALRATENVAFISHRTRDDYARRIMRRPTAGPVVPMGGDGLGLEQQGFSPTRMSFVMLGTIEQRKNAMPVLLAFERLWSEGSDARLVMIGVVSPDAVEEHRLMRRFTGDHRFTHLRDLPDGGVRQALRGARAMVFPSEGEGFGIPPMEALHAGIPVIVSSALPALAGQPGFGQVRLDTVTPETVAGAVRRLLVDETCAALWDEARNMPVPGWSDFAKGVASWVQAD